MIRQFGQTAAGAPVAAVTIAAGGLSACILTLGSVLQDVRLQGRARGLTLGFDSVAGYETAKGYHGAIVGPLANRLAGASADIAGRRYEFAANEPSGALLHSGAPGVHRRLWQVADHGPAHLRLVLDLADGEDGFPGNRRLTAEWRVAEGPVLALRLQAVSDADTLMNLANHSYWNLDGAADTAGHRLRIAADRVTEVDAALLPTGRLLPVAGTALDFRAGQRLGPGAPPLDHNFCLSDGAEPLREVAWLQADGPEGGLRLALATDAPGLQVYDHRHTEPGGPGPHAGIALEPQAWPDAPHHPGFPPVLLRAGAVWEQVVEWRFARVG